MATRVKLTMVIDVEDVESWIEGAKLRAEAMSGDPDMIEDAARAAVEYVELVDADGDPLNGNEWEPVSIDAEIVEVSA